MRLAIEAVAYREERFMPKFIQHYQDKVEEILILSPETKIWTGENAEEDNTAHIAESLGATVIQYDWPNEQETRNTGLDYLSDFDYVLVIDPDEYFDNENWDKLMKFLEEKKPQAALVEGQFTYWKNGWVADPPKDYLQLVAVKPKEVRFVDKRVINAGFVISPAWVHHFSWAKTDEEIHRKIYGYPAESKFHLENRDNWYNNTWLKWKPGNQDVHPNTPETLHNLIKAKLPPEIEALDLWP